MTRSNLERLLALIAPANFTFSSIEDRVHLNVSSATFFQLIHFNIIDIDDPLGGISVEEIQNFVQSNPSFLVRLALIQDHDENVFVDVIGISSGDKMPELPEICAFVELFRHQDEFVLTPDRCFCILD